MNYIKREVEVDGLEMPVGMTIDKTEIKMQFLKDGKPFVTVYKLEGEDVKGLKEKNEQLIKEKRKASLRVSVPDISGYSTDEISFLIFNTLVTHLKLLEIPVLVPDVKIYDTKLYTLKTRMYDYNGDIQHPTFDTTIGVLQIKRLLQSFVDVIKDEVTNGSYVYLVHDENFLRIDEDGMLSMTLNYTMRGDFLRRTPVVAHVEPHVRERLKVGTITTRNQINPDNIL